MTMRPVSSRPALTTAGILLFAAAIAAGCGPDAPPQRNGNLGPPPGNVAPPPVPPRNAAPARPIVTQTTDWQGVEARLTTARRAGQFLIVEIQLANTSGAAVTIDKYSAASANITDDASKQIYEAYAPPGGVAAATTDLTQTLAPGETTTVNASFPLPATARLVTIVFPQIGRFEGVPLDPSDWNKNASK
jgi:hypothetical protein